MGGAECSPARGRRQEVRLGGGGELARPTAVDLPWQRRYDSCGQRRRGSRPGMWAAASGSSRCAARAGRRRGARAAWLTAAGDGECQESPGDEHRTSKSQEHEDSSCECG
ncbi:hypothetical protein SEVIR_1G328601v4 [Setaria viridis]|uniref:Uncharacterized protein n=1 Tax=Setaria viridis TaxID=4556 RepID=A0A4U6WJK7_SETVI|nr:hypothetical protein SEVIR_1G328601v2 [Setaria viridis]